METRQSNSSWSSWRGTRRTYFCQSSPNEAAFLPQTAENRVRFSMLGMQAEQRALSSVMLMVDRHCQRFKVSQTGACLVAGHVPGLSCAGWTPGWHSYTINVSAQTAQSFCLRPAAVLALLKQAGEFKGQPRRRFHIRSAQQDKRKRREDENKGDNGR